MKKLLKRNFLILILSLVLFSTIPVYGFTNDSTNDSTNDYLDQVRKNYEKSQWGLGENLQEGDFYHYRICDDRFVPFEIIGHRCYDLELTFGTILQSWDGPVWIVQGNVTSSQKSQYMIFHVNPETFEINTNNYNSEWANSISETIFSLSQYGENQLKIGSVWGEIESYFTNDTPIKIQRESNIDLDNGKIETFVLGYDVIEESQIFINSQYPFPVKAIVYDPHQIFPKVKELYYFELIEHYNIQDDNY